MSEEQAIDPVGSLGVLDILSKTFKIFIKQIVLFVGLALVVGVGLNLMNYLIFGSALFIEPENMFSSAAGIAAFLSTMVISMIVSTILMAMITLAAYDIHQGRAMRIGAYISVAVRNFIPIIVLTILMSIGVGIASLLLVIPGLYLYAMWLVVVPAIVIDQAGFGGLKRSQELTKGFRWSILGLLILGLIIIILISAVVGGVLGYGFYSMFEGPSGPAVLIFQSIVNSIGYAFFAVLVVMLFARLKELKEGVGMDELVEVFT